MSSASLECSIVAGSQLHIRFETHSSEGFGVLLFGLGECYMARDDRLKSNADESRDERKPDVMGRS
jgi:hypothetical protein